MTKNPVHALTDEELLEHLATAAVVERQASANLIELLAEMDARRLYLAQGYSSLFVYCTRWLHLSEHAAYGRIEAARVARKYPVVLDLLTSGSVTLTTVCLLASHLRPDNHCRLLQSACHKSKREVEELIAAHRPLPPVPSVIRKLPERKEPARQAAPPRSLETHAPAATGPTATSALCGATGVVATASERAPLPSAGLRDVIRPLAPERYKVQVTIDRSTHDKLRKAQELLRHVVPNGDPALILDRALTVLLENLERTKLASVQHPRPPATSNPRGRHVPAAIRREVWKRDGGRCAFVGADGPCGERGFLEFHHVVPFAGGGETTAANLQLRCRAHNAYEATGHFGLSFDREQAIPGELGPDRVSRRHQKR